jgi:2-polyprenyl-6-methoxyphenol hydroxylase-like FAD-dependent oxidoreductase
MSTNEKFKIIIVGGGVAGLTLANMLEIFDIDYVLLEAYHDIAPQVGASIGMFPNGLRILDQIGCYEPITKLPRERLKSAHSRSSDGKSYLVTVDMPGHLERR